MLASKATQELARRELEARKKVLELKDEPLISDKLIGNILGAISDNSVKQEVSSAILAVNNLNAALKKQAEGLEKIAKAQARAFNKLGQAQSDQITTLEANMTAMMKALQQNSEANYQTMRMSNQELSKTVDALKPVDYTMDIKRAGAFISSVDLKVKV